MSESYQLEKGHLEAWWEQGMEGRIEYALAVKDINHPIFLENGQRLIIFAPDGRELWSGRLHFVARKHREKHNLDSGIYAYTKQYGVSYAQWMDWFNHKPPLEAQVLIPEIYEPDESDHPQVIVHPPVLALLGLLASFGLNWLLPLPKVSSLLTLIGFALACLGLALAYWAVKEFRYARTTLHPHGTPDVVVHTGPYGFSRNPIYLGYLVILVGLSLSFRNYWGLILLPVMLLLFQQWVISREETYLEQKFKSMYQAYKARVRRWL